jgi:general secretion pathway protein M
VTQIARQSLSALGFLAVVALLFAGAASTALALWDARANLATLGDADQALKARAQKVGPRKEVTGQASPFLDTPTITLAGAMLQQRVESAIAAAGGKLASSQVEVGGRGNEKRVGLQAELTIAQSGMQSLLFDLEAGAPCLFVESLEAHAPEKIETGGDMRVALTVSGQWAALR